MLLKLILSSLFSASLLAGGPAIAFDQTSHSFGVISNKAKVSTHFQVSNTGDEVLRLIRVGVSCDCTVTAMAKNSLKPGEHVDLEVVFDPVKENGHVTKTIGVASNDPNHPLAELVFNADVTPPIRMSKDDLYFSDLLPSDRITQEIRCVSSSGKTVRILNVQTPELPYMRVERGTDGRDAVVRVLLDGSKLPEGKRTGRESIVLQSNDPEMPEITLNVFWATGQAILAEPQRIAFDPVKAGTGLQHKLTLTQARGRAYKIVSASSSSEIFRVEKLNTKATPRHELTVTLAQDAPSGQHSGRITLNTDDPDQKTVVVEVFALVQ